jgi:hypothetical protein
LHTWTDSSSFVPFDHQEQVVAVVDRRDLELQVVVVPDLRTNRADELEREARAVLDRAAVLVLAVVDRW